MTNTFRTAVARVLLAAATASLIACVDSPMAPGSHVVKGARALKDSIDEINWDDTLYCRHGWGVIQGLVQCGPE